MSEIRVTTLKDTSGGNSSTTAQVASGRSKAWVNFNGQGAVAIRANFNVNSITDHGTGEYSVNYSSALSNANYVFYGSIVGATSATTQYTYSWIAGPADYLNCVHSTSATRFTTVHQNTGLYDHEMVQVAVDGT